MSALTKDNTPELRLNENNSLKGLESTMDITNENQKSCDNLSAMFKLNQAELEVKLTEEDVIGPAR